jgi:hypothetical protein
VEIEKWDTANQQAWLWVKIPTINFNSDTALYLYYDANQPDNTSYVGDVGSAPAQKVWNSAYTGVWHLSENGNGTTGEFKDSTSAGNNGTGGPSGNSLRSVEIMIYNNGSTGNQQLADVNYDSNPAQAARLHVEYSIGGVAQTPVDVQIATGNDDTNRYGTSSFSSGNGNSYTGHDNSLGDLAASKRFNLGVDLTGATITEAHISLYCTGAASIKVQASKVKAPVAPTSGTEFAAITATSASVAWSPNVSNWAWTNSPDIKAVIQELVNLPPEIGRAPSQVDSVIGEGQNLDGNAGYTGGHRQYIEIPDNTGYTISTTNKLTVSFWFQPTVTDWYHTDGNVMDYVNALGKGKGGSQLEWVFTCGGQNSPNKPYEVVYYAHSLSGGYGNGAGVYKSWTANSSLIYCVATFDLNTNLIRGLFYYPYGLFTDTQDFSGLSIQNGTAPIMIGGNWAADQDQYLKSTVDELRINNTVLSDAWIKADYYSQLDNLLYYGEGGGFQSRWEYFTNDTGHVSLGGTRWWAQTFTPSETHTLQTIKLKMIIGGTPSGNLIASIRATSGGLPTGPDLTSGSISCNIIDNRNYEVYAIPVSDLEVSSGTQYAIVVRATGQAYGDIAVSINASGGYSGGHTSSSSNSGSTWSNDSSDLWFEEWGIPIK